MNLCDEYTEMFYQESIEEGRIKVSEKEPIKICIENVDILDVLSSKKLFQQIVKHLLGVESLSDGCRDRYYENKFVKGDKKVIYTYDDRIELLDLKTFTYKVFDCENIEDIKEVSKLTLDTDESKYLSKKEFIDKISVFEDVYYNNNDKIIYKIEYRYKKPDYVDFTIEEFALEYFNIVIK